MRARASEFPNDNTALDCGAVWVVNEPCGGWRAEAPPALTEETTNMDPTPTVISSGCGAWTDNPNGTEDTCRDADENGGGEGIEIVDEFEPFDFDLGTKEDDPFATFVCTLVEVATEAGCEKAAAILPALLDEGRVVAGVISGTVTDALLSSGLLVSTPAGLVGGESFRHTAAAWRAVLRGDSEDYSACGTRMLDEWAADLVAALVAAPSKSERLRRELRTRGVAAFGLVLAA